MMNVAIQAAAKRVSKLDAAPFNTRIDHSRAEITKLEAAINTAFERQTAIQATLRDIREQFALRSNAGNNIANRLLEGNLEAAVQPDTKLLEDELALLLEGVRELRRRIDAERQIISSTQEQKKRALGETCIGLADEIEASAINAVGQLTDLYATSTALMAVAPSAQLASIWRKLSPAITAMCTNNGQIAPKTEGLNVPPTLDSLVDAIRAFDPGLANSVPSNIDVPRVVN